MSTLTRRDYRQPFTDMVEWLEAPLALLRPAAGHPMPVEDYIQDDRYVLRAELPGVNPETDLTVTASDGVLTIKADKPDKTEGAHHSEFRSGTVRAQRPATGHCGRRAHPGELWPRSAGNHCPPEGGR